MDFLVTTGTIFIAHKKSGCRIVRWFPRKRDQKDLGEMALGNDLIKEIYN